VKNYTSKVKHINVLSTLSVAVVIMIWHILAVYIDKVYILPTPMGTAKELLNILLSYEAYIDIFTSVTRLIIGFVISFLMGVIFGVLSGISKSTQDVLSPLVNILRTLPTMVIILVMLIWFGSEITTIFVGVLIVFPIVYSNILYGIKNIDGKLIEMGRTYQFTLTKMLRYIYIPSIHKAIISSIVAGVGLNFKVLIAAEVLSQPKNGIGSNLLLAKMNLQMDKVFAWAILIIALSMALELIFKKLSEANNVANN